MSGVRWTIGILTVAVAFAAGCGKGSGSGGDFERSRKALAPKAPTAAAVPPGEASESEAAEEVVVPTRYAYDPLGKRDPFRSFVLDRMKDQDDETKGPLEQFELSQLDLMGVVWDTNRRRALIADPSGQGYIVSEGDVVGKNDGHIVYIDDNLVLVRERYVDYVGTETMKEIEMRVRQSQGG